MARMELDANAPDFELPDLHGRKVRLSDLWAKGNVILVFNRGFV